MSTFDEFPEEDPKRKPRIAYANSRYMPRLCPELAHELGKLLRQKSATRTNGLNEAIVLLQLDFLISTSSSPKQDDKQWTYQSLEKLKKDYFPFWSRNAIDRALKNLKALGLIEIGNFNKLAYDRTLWYRIMWEEVGKLKSVTVMPEYRYGDEY
jgi:hypothetical protein